ncbi:MAG: diaminopropionate ammonia-lyase [Actinomycetota bacterium]|nr:diaminopropionate ammonia-lyase [Actinomycetota bacterium]
MAHPATILHNPLRSADACQQRPGAGREVLAFHRKLAGYEPTPLVPAPDLAASLGLRALLVKDESSRLGLPAFKMLGASWATYRALVERLGHEPAAWTDAAELSERFAPLGRLRLVAATDGNHGRAVARMAALLGYDASILVPAGTVTARIDAITGEGADVTVIAGTYDDAVAASAALASDSAVVISDTSWPGYADVPRRVIEGYATILSEVDEQVASSRLDAWPEVVVVQMGVGALTAAVVDHADTLIPRPVVVAVEPQGAACGLRSAEARRLVALPGPHESIMAGLNCGTPSEVAWPSVSAGVDVFVAVDDAAAERAMRDLDALGMEPGETGAAGLAGLRALVDAGDADTSLVAGRSVLVICTEGPTDPLAFERIVGHPPSFST